MPPPPPQSISGTELNVAGMGWVGRKEKISAVLWGLKKENDDEKFVVLVLHFSITGGGGKGTDGQTINIVRELFFSPPPPTHTHRKYNGAEHTLVGVLNLILGCWGYYKEKIVPF